eukprot:3665395-Prymnesium_polylepis.1
MHDHRITGRRKLSVGEGRRGQRRGLFRGRLVAHVATIFLVRTARRHVNGEHAPRLAALGHEQVEFATVKSNGELHARKAAVGHYDVYLLHATAFGHVDRHGDAVACEAIFRTCDLELLAVELDQERVAGQHTVRNDHLDDDRHCERGLM